MKVKIFSGKKKLTPQKLSICPRVRTFQDNRIDASNMHPRLHNYPIHATKSISIRYMYNLPIRI